MAKKQKYKGAMTDELAYLHKKFIPYNIVICIISLIAGLAMIFMPWIDLRISISGDKLSPILEEAMATTSSDGSNGSADVDEMEQIEAETTKQMVQVLSSSLKGTKFEIPVNIKPTKLFKAATGEKADLEDFMNSLIGSKGVENFLSDFVNKLAPPLLNAGISVMLMDVENELTEEQKQQVEAYKADVEDVLTALIESKTPEDQAVAREKFETLVEKISAEQGAEEVPEEVYDLFDSVVEMGTKEDGSFDLVEMLKNFDPEKLGFEEDGEDGSESTGGSEYSAYKGGNKVVLTSAAKNDANSSTDSANDKWNAEDKIDQATGGIADQAGPLKEVIEMLENPGGMLLGEMLDENASADDVKTVQLGMLIVYIWMVGIPAFFWFLLALCAGLRCVMQKKTVHIWYVMVFCFWSGFGVLLANVAVMAAPSVLANVVSEGMISTVLSAFTIKFLGSGVVTGICHLALFVLYCAVYARMRKKVKYYVPGTVVMPSENNKDNSSYGEDDTASDEPVEEYEE